MEIPYNISIRPDTGMYNAKLGIWLFLASEVMLFGALFTSYIIERINAPAGTWPIHLLNVPVGLVNTFILVVSSITMVMVWVVLKTRQFKYYRMWLGLTILLGAAFLCVKSTEYYDKYMHWSFWVKDSAFAKYEQQVKDEGDFVGLIPSEGVHELRGHFHGETTDAKTGEVLTYLFIPDKIFVPVVDNLMNKSKATEETEEKPFVVQNADLVRATNFLPQCDTFCALYFTITGLHAMHIIGGIIVMLYFFGPGAALYRRNPEHLANRIEVFGIFWHFVDLVWISAFPILYLF